LYFILILAGTYFYLPESKQSNPDFSLKPAPIVRNFISVLRHPHFTTYALTVAGSPYVFIEIQEVSEAAFGWIFAVIAAVLIGASKVNNFMLKRSTSEQIIKVASMRLIGAIQMGIGACASAFVQFCCRFSLHWEEYPGN
jgi:DHA1 family bicyclomycin/chloramphenicol resistance-like MFS transporter